MFQWSIFTTATRNGWKWKEKGHLHRKLQLKLGQCREQVFAVRDFVSDIRRQSTYYSNKYSLTFKRKNSVFLANRMENRH